jgi:hypothetical protein
VAARWSHTSRTISYFWSIIHEKSLPGTWFSNLCLYFDTPKSAKKGLLSTPPCGAYSPSKSACIYARAADFFQSNLAELYMPVVMRHLKSTTTTTTILLLLLSLDCFLSLSLPDQKFDDYEISCFVTYLWPRSVSRPDWKFVNYEISCFVT